MQKTVQIQIHPIFDQAAPTVWEDFIRIQSAALSYTMDTKQHDLIMRDFKLAWKKKHINFAFGAYAGMDMVGFVRGSCIANRSIAEISELFVLPEFQNQGIGHRLLVSAEATAALVSNKISVWTDVNGGEYFRIKGFKSAQDYPFTHFEKETNPLVALRVQPVFHATPAITDACNTILKNKQSSDIFAPAHVNEKHLPMWVYIMHEPKMDKKPEVRGFATLPQRKLPKIYISDGTAPWAGAYLTDAANKYKYFKSRKYKAK